MIPIITHPERNVHLRRSLDDLARWVESGCYVQVTAGSFTGAFGKPARSTAAELVARGLVHVVASDAHDTVRRPPNLQAAYERLANDWGEETIRPLFVENPDAILRGEPIDYELPAQRLKRRTWYRFWT